MAEPKHDAGYRLRRPGGEIDSNRVFNTPGVVLAIALFTGACFLLIVLAPRTAALIIQYGAAVSPARFALGPEGNNGLLGMISPLIAHMFVHAGIVHLLMNMFFLLAFGTPVARRMRTEHALRSFPAFASASMFLTFYLLCGIAGALAYIALHANEQVLLVGASGGVSGLLGGLVRFAFNRSTLFGPEGAQMSGLLSPVVITWSSFIIMMNVVFGVFGGVMTGGGGIAWEAHLGGYFFGLLFYPFFERAARSLH